VASAYGPTDDNQRWSRVSFDIRGCTPTQAPSVRSAGIGSQITGSRADIILLDDVEVTSNSATDSLREKLLAQCTEMEAILIPKPSSKILYLGTPQTSYTIYRKLEERGYQARIWPARYPKNPGIYEGRLFPQLVADLEAGAKAGDPTDSRFSDAELLRGKPRWVKVPTVCNSRSIQPCPIRTSSPCGLLT
jgi:hypothetical protein